MTKSSAARKSRRRRSKVVPIKGKKGLRLTELERVSVYNCILRIQLIQEEANKRAAVVEAQKNAIMKEIGERLGITMDAYMVNLDDGAVTPLNGGASADAKPPEDVKQDDSAHGSGGGG